MNKRIINIGKGIGYGILAYILIAIVSFTVVSLHDSLKDRGGFKLSELTENVGYQVCTSSVNSPTLLCDKDRTAIPLYNISQEKLIEVIKECGIDSEIIQSSYCIGDYLEIRNLKEYYTN